MEGIAQTPPGPFQVGEDAKNYDACIRKFGPGPWDVALYPPLPVETFGLGAIFADFPALRSESNTLSRDSAIRTYSTNIMPMHLWNAALRPRQRDRLDPIFNPDGIVYHGARSISPYENLSPNILYTLRPGPGDVFIREYTAPAYKEGALLVSSPDNSFKQSLEMSEIINSQWWLTLKYQKFEDEGANEVSMVTDIRTTYRWATVYKRPDDPYASHFVVNCDRDGKIAPYFFVHHDGSTKVTHSQEHLGLEYTVLAKKAKVRKCDAGGFGRWVTIFKRLPYRWRTFIGQRRRRPGLDMIDMEPIEHSSRTARVNETVSEMDLGYSLRLVEITDPSGTPRYSLQSYGSEDGSFSLFDYIRILQGYAFQNSYSDWRELLPLIYRPPTSVSRATLTAENQQAANLTVSSSYPGTTPLQTAPVQDFNRLWPAPMSLYSYANQLFFTPWPGNEGSAPASQGIPVVNRTALQPETTNAGINIVPASYGNNSAQSAYMTHSHPAGVNNASLAFPNYPQNSTSTAPTFAGEPIDNPFSPSFMS